MKLKLGFYRGVRAYIIAKIVSRFISGTLYHACTRNKDPIPNCHDAKEAALLQGRSCRQGGEDLVFWLLRFCQEHFSILPTRTRIITSQTPYHCHYFEDPLSGSFSIPKSKHPKRRLLSPGLLLGNFNYVNILWVVVKVMISFWVP